jgi:lipopolysaccharide export system ATP-binding protein
LSLTIHSQDLVKTYHNRTVVNHVSVNLQQGEIVGLLGPNGAGKTTTFYMVVGLIKPDAGDVFLDDINITRLPMYKRAQMGIGYLPQEASVFRKLSVEDNIKAVLEMTDLTRAQQKEKLEALLDEFRLHHVRKNNGDSLSGGERRRTEIARALAVDPKFILLDEPFAGVDPIAVEDIQTVVARLKFRNIGILITDHNVNETLSICDRAYLLIDGKIFKHGSAEELAEDEQVRRLYLGRNFELKRKDYLHEEARRSAGPSREAIIISVRNAIEQLGNIKRLRGERSRSAVMLRGKYGGITTSDKINESDELGLDDFAKLIPEIKAAVLKFAQDNHNQELTTIATRLSADENDAVTDLNDLLLQLEASDS